jgi:hypothetical protein
MPSRVGVGVSVGESRVTGSGLRPLFAEPYLHPDSVRLRTRATETEQTEIRIRGGLAYAYAYAYA